MRQPRFQCNPAHGTLGDGPTFSMFQGAPQVPTSETPSRPRRARREISEEQFNRSLNIASRLALVFVAAVVLIAVLKIGQPILLPVGLAIVVGLVFGPVTDRLEAWGIQPALSAGIAVLIFLAVIATAIVLFSVPLAEWLARWPAIWQRLQTELFNWRQSLEMLSTLQEEIDTALGSGEGMRVQVEEGSQVLDVAMIAPAVLGDILIFLASLYFYLATRESIRMSILSIIVSRKLRWRAAHLFSGIETKVSRFLLTVTALNVVHGTLVTIIAFTFGMPSPLLWGFTAGILNYIPYVGQAIMIGVLLLVGFATQSDLLLILGPVALYMVVNMVEGQFVFPVFVGRIMTLNPFLIFFSIIFWFWVWGPIGSLMAVPSLIILQALVVSLVPPKEVKPRRPVRRTAGMSERDVILENAARAIREEAQRREAEQAAVDAEKAAASEPAKAK